MDLFDRHNLPDTLDVKVIPKAKSEHIKKEIRDDGAVLYKIYVTATPEDGKANKAVINLLAKTLRVPKSSLSIMRGHTTREKVIKIEA